MAHRRGVVDGTEPSTTLHRRHRRVVDGDGPPTTLRRRRHHCRCWVGTAWIEGGGECEGMRARVKAGEAGARGRATDVLVFVSRLRTTRVGTWSK